MPRRCSPEIRAGGRRRHGRRLGGLRGVQEDADRHRHESQRRRLRHARVPEERLPVPHVGARCSASTATRRRRRSIRPTSSTPTGRSSTAAQPLRAALRARPAAAGQRLLVADAVRAAVEPAVRQPARPLPDQLADAAEAEARCRRRHDAPCPARLARRGREPTGCPRPGAVLRVLRLYWPKAEALDGSGRRRRCGRTRRPTAP